MTSRPLGETASEDHSFNSPIVPIVTCAGFCGGAVRRVAMTATTIATSTIAPMRNAGVLAG